MVSPPDGAARPALVLLHQNTHMGGAELSVLDILRQAKAWGHGVHLITEAPGALHEAFLGVVDSWCRAPFLYPGRPLSWPHIFAFRAKAGRLLDAIPGAKLLWVGDFHPGWCASLLLPRPGLRLCLHWQGEYSFKGDGDARKWLRYGARHAQQLVSSPFVAAHMNEQSCLPRMVANLPPVIDRARFDPRRTMPETLRQNYGWTDGRRTAFCPGRIGPGKGQLRLLRAFLKDEDLRRRWRLVFAGPCEEAAHLREFTALLAGQDVAAWLGPRSDVSELLAACDLAVFPGLLSENFPRVILEAALMSRPFLAYAVGSPARMAAGYPGLLPPEEAPAAFLDRLRTLGPAELAQWRDELNRLPLKDFTLETWQADLARLLALTPELSVPAGGS